MLCVCPPSPHPPQENRSAAGKGKRYWEWRNQDGTLKYVVVEDASDVLMCCRTHDSRGTRRLVSLPFYHNPVHASHQSSLAFEAPKAGSRQQVDEV